MPQRPESFYESTLATSLTAVATTIAVTTAPNETSGYLVIEANTSNREIIKYAGVTGTTLTGCTRGLAEYGSDDSGGTGKAHSAGVDIANRDVNYYYAQYYDFLTGASATGSNAMRIGDGNTISASDRLWYVQTSSLSAYWGLSANGTMVVSEDGITSYVVSAGGSGVTAGDGIDITGGVASVDSLSSGGLQISASKLKVGYGEGLAATSAGELYATGYTPTGTIVMWSTSSAPASLLICYCTEYDGSASSTYADLWDVLGTTYGGSSVSAFNVPDLRTRIAVGLSANATAAYCSAMGYTDGVSAHTLTTAEMPSHTHNDAGSSFGVAGGSGDFAAGSAANTTTSAAGGGGAHNNLQPYIVLTYIIKK